MLLTMSYSRTQDELESNPIVEYVEELAVKEDISNMDLEIYYRIYRGAYYWGNDLDYQDCKDFGEVFDRMRLVKTALEPVGTRNFSNGLNQKIKDFIDEVDSNGNPTGQDKPFEPIYKNEYTDLMFYISEGLKEALNNDRSE